MQAGQESELIKEAHEKKVNATKALEGHQKAGKLNKAEVKDIKEIFKSAEVEKLPPGNTAWRLSNSISLFAQSVDGSRALELETLAGHVAGIQAAA